MRICNIAFDALVDDTKALVADGVRADIARRIADASTQALSEAASQRGIFREANLRSWLKKSYPLALGPDTGCDEAYKLLLRAVAPDEHSVAQGLPNWDRNSMSRLEFVQSLLDMSRPVDPIPVRAPAAKNGAFIEVLKVAHSSLLSLTNDKTKDDQQLYLKTIFHKALLIFKINFFPYHKHSSSPGAPSRKPVFNSWAVVGKEDSISLPPLDGPGLSLSTSPSIPPESIAFNNAIQSDGNSAWYAKDLALHTLHTVLSKTSLPSDFEPPSRANVPYVDDSYTWLRQNYDHKKPIHHLALLVSIIVASSILPNLFMPATAKEHFSNTLTKEGVRSVYNNHVPWISKQKKGMTRKSIFIAMFTTFIVCLYEEDSPLRRHMSTSASAGKRGGLGDDWTKKHCMRSVLFHFFSISHLPLSQAVKGITYTNLIRLGLFWGLGYGAYDKGIFGKSWGTHSDVHIQHLYDKLRLKLNESPFGSFDSLSILIGEKNARIVCTAKNYPSRPSAPSPSPHPMQQPDYMVVYDE